MKKIFWLQGGVIAIIITALVSLLSIIFTPLRLAFIPGGIINVLVDEMTFGGTIYSPTFTGNISFILAIITSLIIYFIAGSLIGLVFQKFSK